MIASEAGVGQEQFLTNRLRLTALTRYAMLAIVPPPTALREQGCWTGFLPVVEGSSGLSYLAVGLRSIHTVSKRSIHVNNQVPTRSVPSLSPQVCYPHTGTPPTGYTSAEPNHYLRNGSFVQP
jgi:hypothetical protein